MFELSSTILSTLHFLLVAGISVRVIMNRPAVGVALAWISIVAVIPFGGAGIYVLFGERRISLRRARRIDRLRYAYEPLKELATKAGFTDVEWDQLPPEAQGMNQLAINLVGIPTVTGSEGILFDSTPEILERIAADIRASKRSVLMEFYIWNSGGLANDVLSALEEAARRGVSCRVLIDHLGARPWWRSAEPERLRAAGVDVRQALTVGPFRILFGRGDLRLHRKIVVIDGNIAWTGSMNMVDPHFFKQEAHVGEWVDAMVRLEGAAVLPLGLTVIGDWILETDESIDEILHDTDLRSVKPTGTAVAQVVPSGPGETMDGLLQMLIALANSARTELVMTTPYFVPDESLLRAIRAAAARGVEVRIVLPERVDSLMTRLASRSYYDELFATGAKIHLYRKGLLHTKSITADRRMTMFGTVNLDMRSIWLNYEVALFGYGEPFSQKVRSLQQSYIEDSDLLDPVEWAKRGEMQKFIENVFRLVSPIL
jgi:cardiolipin synthase